MLLQILANALALGASYALLALGFVLILNATSAVNFTHGDMVMASGYVAIALFSVLPVPGALLLPLVMAVMAAAARAMRALPPPPSLVGMRWLAMRLDRMCRVGCPVRKRLATSLARPRPTSVWMDRRWPMR